MTAINHLLKLKQMKLIKTKQRRRQWISKVILNNKDKDFHSAVASVCGHNWLWITRRNPT